MLVTIQELHHHIRTSFSTSESTLHNEAPTPFQGICQGNRAGPAIWIAVSVPLIEMMKTAGHVMKLESPLSHTTTEFMEFTFVDDTDLVTGDLTAVNLTTEEVYAHMQEAILRWEGGLKAMGGALWPEKFFVYPLIFSWDERGIIHLGTPMRSISC